MQYKRAGMRLLAVFLGIAVALCVSEIAIRIINPPAFRLSVKAHYQINLETYRHKVFHNTPASERYIPGLDSVIYQTKNQLGFRGPDLPADTQSLFKIVCVGGSTTECQYISDGKDWPEVLGQRLQNDGPCVWVNNAGIDGQSTFGHDVILKQYVLPLHPQMITFLVGCNDVGRDDLSTNDNTTPPISQYEHSVFVKLASYSRLISYILDLKLNHEREEMARKQKLLHQAVDFKRLGMVDVDSVQEQQIIAKHQKEYLSSYRQRLLKLIEACKNNHAVPIMITQPTVLGAGIDSVSGIDLARVGQGEDMNGRVYWDVLQLYNKTLKDVCAETNTYCIDLAEKMPKNSRYFYDFFHFNNAGCQMAANIIGDELNAHYPNMCSGKP